MLNLISINATAQLPLKLTPTNYPSWWAQINAMLFGYLDGSNKCPSKTIVKDDKEVPNNAHALWLRQDRLILNFILASVSKHVM